MFISHIVHECVIESDSSFIYMEFDQKKWLEKRRKIKYADKLRTIIDFALITINLNGI